MKTYSGYTLKDGTKLYWDYVYKDDKENGYEVYVGENPIPVQRQPEPYIANPSLSYEENALNICKEMSEVSNTPYVEPFEMTESMYTDMQSNIDYLMLLNDTTEE